MSATSCFSANDNNSLKPIVGTAHTAGTVSSSVVTGPSLLTLDAATEFVEIQCTDQQIRHTYTGTTPSAAVGYLMTVNSVRVMSRSMWNNSRFIRNGATDGTLQIAQLRSS